MSGPELPPYLSYSTAIITRPGGGTETSSTLVQVPLTYYGPSIPLGTNGVWTYGGLTSPASTPAASTTALGTASFSSLPTITSGPSSTSALGTASFASSPVVTGLSTAPTTALGTATFSSLASGMPTTSALATATFGSSPVGTSGLSTTALATATFASSASPVTTALSTAPSVSIFISTVTVIISVTPGSSGSSLSTTASTSSIASTAVTSSSSAIPSSSTSITSASTSSSASVIPTITSSLSSSSSSSSSASSTSSSSLSQFPLTPPPSSTTSSPTSSSTVPPASPIIKGSVIGIVVGTILGAVLLFLLLLIFLRWRRRRDNGAYQTPIWTGWEIVDPTPEGENDNDRPPGEGSPRGSGEEADSLLRRSRSAGGAMLMLDTGGSASVPGAAGGSHSGTNGSHNSDSTVSDYGVLLPGSDYTDDQEGSSLTHVPARPSTELGFIDDSRGYIIPPSELLRMDAEEREHLMKNEPSSSRAAPEQYSPLLPPPRLDPDRTAHFSSKKTASGGSVHDLDDPMVLTARRVRMSQIGPRAEPESHLQDEPSPEAGPSAGWGSLGLGGIARLSRLSWFKNFRENLQDSPTRSSSKQSRPTSYVSRGLSDNDVESGRALLSDEFKRVSRFGLEPGERPISTVSAKSAASGTTVYHDARSLAGTPPPLPPLPRAFLSGSPTDVSQGHGGATDPPSYESGQVQGSQTLKDSDVPRGVDILDLPAPSSVSQFSSPSSGGTMLFPPGLVQLPTPRSWYESSSSEGENVTIDVLEDEPPRAGDGWRVLARNANLGNAGHRSSFGVPQFVQSHDLTAISEVGSLHSMRSHLNPFSGRSSGSAPASSRLNFSGSNSSRPSRYSHGQTGSPISLAHSGSISSDGQRRLRGPVSPALSAFGYPNSPSSPDQFPAPAPPPPPYIPRSPLGGVPEATVRSVTTGTPGTSTTGSADTEATYKNNMDYVADHTTEDPHLLLTMPWATGLDD